MEFCRNLTIQKINNRSIHIHSHTSRIHQRYCINTRSHTHVQLGIKYFYAILIQFRFVLYDGFCVKIDCPDKEMVRLVLKSILFHWKRYSASKQTTRVMSFACQFVWASVSLVFFLLQLLLHLFYFKCYTYYGMRVIFCGNIRNFKLEIAASVFFFFFLEQQNQ